MNRTLVFFTCLLLLFGGLAMLWVASSKIQAESGSIAEVDPDYVAPVKELNDFEFTDQLGTPFHSKQLDGEIWLGTFFFADCPSICAQQNQEIAKLHKRFRDQGVKIVNITVAPDDDPAHKLLVYANRFSADHQTWKFLTGKDIKYVRQVGADIFGLPAADETHTAEVAVFDREGKKHGTYNVIEGIEYAKCVKKVDELLALPNQADKPVEDAVDEAQTSADSLVPTGQT